MTSSHHRASRSHGIPRRADATQRAHGCRRTRIGACALQMLLCMKDVLVISYVLFATACTASDGTAGDPMTDPDSAPDPGQTQGLDQQDPAPAGESQATGEVQAASGTPDITTTGSTTFRVQTSLAG